METDKTECKPMGAEARIRYNDEEEVHTVYISFGEERYDEHERDVVMDEYGVLDEDIFFYGALEDEKFYRKGAEDWTLISWELEYPA